MLPWGAAAQEEPDPIVVEVPEPEAEALDVLDDQVGALGGGVGESGAVPTQDRGFPAGDGAGEPFELGHLATSAVVVEDDEPPAGLEGVGGEVAVAQQLLGEVGGADLALGIARVEPGEHSGEGGRIEAVVAGQKPPAEPGERIVPSAPVTEGSFWVRRRTSSSAALARRITWKWSTT